MTEGSAEPGRAELELEEIKAELYRTDSYYESCGHDSVDHPTFRCAATAIKALLSEVERLRAALHAATAPQEGWQPIATAPKDGTRILLYQDGAMIMGDWSILPFRVETTAYWRDDVLDRINPAPTLWHALPPLPAAPQVAQEGQP